jgi:hypothetical protein
MCCMHALVASLLGERRLSLALIHHVRHSETQILAYLSLSPGRNQPAAYLVVPTHWDAGSVVPGRPVTLDDMRATLPAPVASQR